jgi:hypothetical protein
MNISLDLNYFIDQISLKEDKELLTKYYEHITKHIEITNNNLKEKTQFLEILINYQNNNNNTINNTTINNNHKELIHNLINEIKNSIKLIENDGINYKNLFREILFQLIKKK